MKGDFIKIPQIKTMIKTRPGFTSPPDCHQQQPHGGIASVWLLKKDFVRVMGSYCTGIMWNFWALSSEASHTVREVKLSVWLAVSFTEGSPSSPEGLFLIQLHQDSLTDTHPGEDATDQVWVREAGLLWDFNPWGNKWHQQSRWDLLDGGLLKKRQVLFGTS